LNNEGVEYCDLPTKRWLEFFRELGEAKVMEVSLAGGEPFLREDLFELLNGIEENRMRFLIATNGQHVTRDIAARLKKSRRCQFVQISLDGARPETHESLRGKGTHARALNAIKALKEEGVPVTVRTTVHPGNIDDLAAAGS
jgi:MoaA/NifB/PqqE/SkfB family radical SAM enzyme